MKTKIIYLRVSKKELNEKTQLPVIINKYNLKESEYIILSDKLSGYKEEMQEKRNGLNKLLELIETNQIKEIYIYSLERIYRNIDWLLRFYFICRTKEIEIYSYLQPEINMFNGKSPINIFLKYQSVLVNGFMAHQESYLISERTKKSFNKDSKGINRSYKGNKLGRKTDLQIEDIDKIKKLSKTLSYREIQKVFLKENKNITLSSISIVLNS